VPVDVDASVPWTGPADPPDAGPALIGELLLREFRAQRGGDPATDAPGVDPATPEVPGRAAVRAGTDGSVVVLDVAVGDERRSGADALPVVRAVAVRLVGQLPAGARVRDDGPDSISIVLPGRRPDSAAEWARRLVPVLLDGLAGECTIPGARLRATVHDVDGSSGVHVLHPIAAAGPGADGPDDGAAVGGRHGAGEGRQPFRAAAAAQHAGRATRSGEPVARAAGPAGPPAGPGPAGPHAGDAERPAGGGAADPPPGDAPRGAAPDPTADLGLADLLAGALAAYRSL
jgi:hypothetical protein